MKTDKLAVFKGKYQMITQFRLISIKKITPLRSGHNGVFYSFY